MDPAEAGVLVTDWTAAFAPLGLVPLEEIGSGMEGTVLRLEGDLVAKVWHFAGADDLAVRQRFYTDVADALPLRTTRMLDVVPVEERWASIEPLLHGTPLAGPPTPGAVDAVADVLAALASVTPTPAMTSLAALPGEPPLDVSGGFGSGLAALVERRASRVLAAAIPDFAEVLASVAAALRSLPPEPAALVHGDLIPANVLLDDAGRASAVIDFGFLTTVGDPAFDAAVTASIFDMYGAVRAVRGGAARRTAPGRAAACGGAPRGVRDQHRDLLQPHRRGRPLRLVRRDAASRRGAGRCGARA